VKLFKLNRQVQGEIYILSASFIEAWFPIATFYLAHSIGGIHALFYSLVIAGTVLGVYAFWTGRYKQFSDISAYPALLKTSFLMATLFMLIFVGAQYTTASHVALIIFLQLLFAYLYFQRSAEEYLNRQHLLGAILMGLGAIIILFPVGEVWKINLGDILVLLAAMIAPLGNYYQKQARKKVHSTNILLSRSLIGIPLVYGMATIFEVTPSWQMIQSQWPWLLFLGLMIFVMSKILWMESLHRLSITKVSAIYAVSPLITLGLAYWLLNEVPSFWQLLAVLPIILGGYLITRPAAK
jgi:drug/metabolite transporter (DMT)-like permease